MFPPALGQRREVRGRQRHALLAVLWVGCSAAPSVPQTSPTVLGAAQVSAFVSTKDGARALAFYQGVLGLPLVKDDPGALVFEVHGTMLRVQRVKEVLVAPYTVLGWNVPDIHKAVEQLSARGVVFERFGFFVQDAAGVWKAPDGTQVAWFKDPDGNLLSLAQF